MEYPRVLVISVNALNTNSATGITMVNLFKGWPLDRIAQVYIEDSRPNPDACLNGWRISNKDVPLVGWIKKLAISLKLRRNSISSNFPQKFDDARPAYQSGRKFFSPGIATAWASIIPAQLSGDFWQWIYYYKPEVIYSVLGGIRIMDIVLRVSNSLSIPIVPHFMDDWPSTFFAHEFTHLIPRIILLSALKRVLRKSLYPLVISRAMAEEYKTRYGFHFEAFMNCVDFDEKQQTQLMGRKNEIIFGYVGGLHLSRWESLMQISDAVLQMKDEGYNIKLIVFAPFKDIMQYGHVLGSNSAIEIGGSISSADTMKTLEKFDVLVHTESFDELDQRYTRLSISTKIPQYMASGKPILVYGPKGIASSRYIEEEGCGLVVAERNQKSIKASIRMLADSPSLRQKLGQRGRNVAFERHNAKTERERFRNLLYQNVRAKEIK